MFKIRKISVENHPVLGSLELDFCDANGKAVDTVILAGENGCGKSTILNLIYEVVTGNPKYPLKLELEENGAIKTLDYFVSEHGDIWVRGADLINTLPSFDAFKKRFDFKGIYSDVDINFHSQEISNVTSLELDNSQLSRKSSTNLPKEIKQLLIDIQALDDSQLASAFGAAKEKGEDLNKLVIERRMERFTNAFNVMFDTLKYKRIANDGKNKNIIFTKNGIDVSIEELSSGEKQIVYRGCFLLKDINAINGAFVFIDEPEISLHPTWQMKIMNYYKSIFTDCNGKQTSQIFTVTHSPFIIHNDNRKNDKVLVLARDAEGKIVAQDKPEYYCCSSTQLVADAFSINNFSPDKSTVYLEGRTDEKYFKKAVEVFELETPFEFKWVGYWDEKEGEVNTGDKSVDKAFYFLVGRNLPIKNFCLKDCDTKAETKTINNVTLLSMPFHENAKNIRKGIENALVLDDIDLRPFYSAKISTGSYGETKNIEEFDKMACCDAICTMDKETLKKVFVNLKTEIDKLVLMYNEP